VPEQGITYYCPYPGPALPLSWPCPAPKAAPSSTMRRGSTRRHGSIYYCPYPGPVLLLNTRPKSSTMRRGSIQSRYHLLHPLLPCVLMYCIDNEACTHCKKSPGGAWLLRASILTLALYLLPPSAIFCAG